MFQENMKKAVIDICMVISVFFALYYFTTTHFDFMVSLFHYRMFNLSAISYTIIRFVQLLIPIFFLVPRFKLSKVRTLKKLFYLMGILYVTGSSWIVNFIIDNPITMLGDLNATHEYLQAHALNFGYLIWDAYDLFGILFSLIQAALYFVLGYYIDKRRRRPLKIYWATLICSIVLPYLYVYVISGIGAFSSMWLQKNIVLFASGLFSAVGLTVAATSRGMWGEVIWG